ncbi:MAG: OmpA family protein [Saprospiraceae bacterium]
MPRLALLPIGLFIIWSFVCQRWYVCHIKQKCEATEQSEEVPPPATVDNRPLVFTWSDPTPQTRSSFGAFRDSLLKTLPEDKLFEIVGEYYPKEKTPEGFSNLGLARADALKKLFQDAGLEEERIVASSNPFSGVKSPVEGPFAAARFNFKDIPKADKVEIIEVENQISILFPYGSATKAPDPQVDDYISRLVKHLEQTTETVSVTGHTDNTGPEDFNNNLGLSRARYIQQILLSKGIAKDRISIASKGETEPVASNDTEEGRRQNRRVVLVLNKQ